MAGALPGRQCRRARCTGIRARRARYDRRVPDELAATHTFQVDLQGLVDLLSRHLYSSPRVFLRELLQNAVDAVTARRLADPAAPAAITIRTAPGAGAGLVIEDTGIGLTEEDVHVFLATIGRSSKRTSLDGLDFADARQDFIGQFGIGLLSCFIVADEITVVSRSAARPDSPPVHWRGTADGRYELRRLDPAQLPEPGTRVSLTARPGCEEWLAPDRVAGLARHFGDLLPVPVELVAADGSRSLANGTPAPWDRAHASPSARRAALLEYGAAALGFAPLDVIELDLPLVGLRGAAYVLPGPVSPAETGRHRVYLKGMLLTEAATGLLPEWAFFVRCVVSADGLRPTASREGLYEDAALDAVREGLGGAIRDWLAELAGSRPGDLRRFLAAHHLAVKALARFDTELLALMLPWLPFETTDGEVSLEEFARAHPSILVSRTTDEFHQVAAIAAAAGLAVVNGGYAYDSELVRRLPEIRPGVTVADLDTGAVVAHLDPAGTAAELAAGAFLAVARRTLDPLGCEAILRSFAPASLPALLLDDREARHERARAQAAAEADGLWGEILGALRGTAPRARLVLNQQNPLVRRMAGLADQELAATAVEALYGHALLMSRRPLRAAESALLNRAFLGLLDHAVQRPAPGA
jgi:molecular chaperone HtpG